jgi:hypothetical protein
MATKATAAKEVIRRRREGADTGSSYWGCVVAALFATYAMRTLLHDQQYRYGPFGQTRALKHLSGTDDRQPAHCYR